MFFVPGFRKWSGRVLVPVAFAAIVFSAAPLPAQEDSSPPVTSAPAGKDEDAPKGTVRLKIQVVNPNGNPVGNASVYVRYYKGGGVFHSDELAELDFKTNMDGTVKVPPVPQGKIQIQVIARGWHTFGEWYDVEKDEQLVRIQLQEPPHWD